MAGNNSKTKMTKNKNGQTARRKDPMTVRQIPRPKMNFNFDGQFLNGSGYTTSFTTIGNLAVGLFYLDCSTRDGTGNTVNNYERSVARDYSSITGIYNEFVYHSLKVEWVPFLSPGISDGGSQIYIDYIDNAEAISTTTGASTATVFGVAKNSRNSKFFNAWERFTYVVPISRRRKTFDVNTTTLYTVDVCDRSVQGAVAFGINTISPIAVAGQLRFTYNLELRTLNNSITT
jgi:hypothetical protein